MDKKRNRAFWGYKKRHVRKYVDHVLREHEAYISKIKNDIEDARTRKAKLEKESARPDTVMEVGINNPVQNDRQSEVVQSKITKPNPIEDDSVKKAIRKVEKDRIKFYENELVLLKDTIIKNRDRINKIICFCEREESFEKNEDSYRRDMGEAKEEYKNEIVVETVEEIKTEEETEEETEIETEIEIGTEEEIEDTKEVIKGYSESHDQDEPELGPVASILVNKNTEFSENENLNEDFVVLKGGENSFWGLTTNYENFIDRPIYEEQTQQQDLNSNINEFFDRVRSGNKWEATEKDFQADKGIFTEDIVGAGFWSIDLDEAVASLEAELIEETQDENFYKAFDNKSKENAEDLLSLRHRYIVGKISGETILDLRGKVIIAKNETISPEVVEIAKAEGKLAELIMNMMIPDTE